MPDHPLRVKTHLQRCETPMVQAPPHIVQFEEEVVGTSSPGFVLLMGAVTHEEMGSPERLTMKVGPRHEHDDELAVEEYDAEAQV